MCRVTSVPQCGKRRIQRPAQRRGSPSSPSSNPSNQSTTTAAATRPRDSIRGEEGEDERIRRGGRTRSKGGIREIDDESDSRVVQPCVVKFFSLFWDKKKKGFPSAESEEMTQETEKGGPALFGRAPLRPAGWIRVSSTPRAPPPPPRLAAHASEGRGCGEGSGKCLGVGDVPERPAGVRRPRRAAAAPRGGSEESGDADDAGGGERRTSGKTGSGTGEVLRFVGGGSRRIW